MSAITTHILDTSLGKPASGVKITLEFLQGETWTPAGGGQTDSDGRVKGLVSESFEFRPGTYRLDFAVADYFKSKQTECFYPYVQIVFHLQDTESHYHVPLLLNPFGYSTYRGS